MDNETKEALLHMYAGLAMNGLIASKSGSPQDFDLVGIRAVKYAEGLVRALEKREDEEAEPIRSPSVDPSEASK